MLAVAKNATEMQNEGGRNTIPTQGTKYFFAVAQLTHLAQFVQKCANYAKCVMQFFYRFHT